MKESLPGVATSEDWRFALLVEHLSKWQDTFLGHWELGTGHWTFVFRYFEGLRDSCRYAG